MTKPLIFLDLESTGVNVEQCKVIELATVELGGPNDGKTKHWRFNPGVPIPPEITKLTGITDEMVKDAPFFKECCEDVFDTFVGKDLGGFGLLRMDIPLLIKEFQLCGIDFDPQHPNWDAKIIDAGAIFVKKNPRTLSAAVKTYLGLEHTGAHGALADAIASKEVFLAQLKQHSELGKMTIGQLDKFCVLSQDQRVDLAGKLSRNEAGEVIFNFGKHRGEKLKDHLDYARWMLTKDFSLNTKRWVEKELDLLDQQQPFQEE